MDHLLQELGFSPKDLVMLGVCIGFWLSARSRRHQGQRIGDAEKKITELITARGASGPRE